MKYLLLVNNDYSGDAANSHYKDLEKNGGFINSTYERSDDLYRWILKSKGINDPIHLFPEREMIDLYFDFNGDYLEDISREDVGSLDELINYAPDNMHNNFSIDWFATIDLRDYVLADSDVLEDLGFHPVWIGNSELLIDVEFVEKELGMKLGSFIDELVATLNGTGFYTIEITELGDDGSINSEDYVDIGPYGYDALTDEDLLNALYSVFGSEGVTGVYVDKDSDALDMLNLNKIKVVQAEAESFKLREV